MRTTAFRIEEKGRSSSGILRTRSMEVAFGTIRWITRARILDEPVELARKPRVGREPDQCLGESVANRIVRPAEFAGRWIPRP
jgi:hypothetical protein